MALLIGGTPALRDAEIRGVDLGGVEIGGA
jgi:hypothetical protein